MGNRCVHAYIYIYIADIVILLLLLLLSSLLLLIFIDSIIIITIVIHVNIYYIYIYITLWNWWIGPAHGCFIFKQTQPRDKIHAALKACYRPISEIHTPGSRSRGIQSNLMSFISNDVLPVPRSIVKWWPWTHHAILGWIFSPRLVGVARIWAIPGSPHQFFNSYCYWIKKKNIGQKWAQKGCFSIYFCWYFVDSSGGWGGHAWTPADSMAARQSQASTDARYAKHTLAQNLDDATWNGHGMPWDWLGWLKMTEKWSKSH